MNRIDQLKQMLSASLNGEGQPARGFKKRVAAIRKEIQRLETSRTDA